METTQHQLDKVHEFALAKLDQGGDPLTIEELFEEWRLNNSTTEQRAEDYNAIAASLDDFDKGERGTEASRFLSDFRSRNGIS